jgi:hypothetical protein
MIKKFKLSFLEIPLALLGFLIAWDWLGRHALGGPLSTDSNGYMNLALNPAVDASVMNRFMHIYMMRVFLKLAPTPLTGFQYYWAFLLAATALLVYINARSITSRSTFIHGLLAVGIFFTIPEFAQEAGMAGVDMAAMFMIMVMVTFFVLSVRRQHRSTWLLGGLGFVFFLALRTKETALVTALLFIGLGVEDGQFRFKELWHRLVYVIAGLLAGIVFFAMLNWILVGDPLFGWRLSNIRDFLSNYVGPTTGQSRTDAVSGNWYSAYILGVIYIPFILYLIGGIRFSHDLDLGQKLVWCLPLALVCFVCLFTSITWGPRFLLPAVPIICLLGPQFLDFSIPEENRERVKLLIISVIALGLLLTLRLAMRVLVPRMGWNIDLFYVTFYVPAVLSSILAISFLWKRFSASISIVGAVLIIALVVTPVVTNARTMLKAKNRTESNLVYYPYSAFKDEIHFTPGMKMFVSFDAWNTLGVGGYCNTTDDVRDIFNVVFDASSTRSNFTVPYYLAKYATQSELDADATQASYTYLLLSTEDWHKLPSAERLTLEQHYTLSEDPLGRLEFLKTK